MVIREWKAKAEKELERITDSPSFEAGCMAQEVIGQRFSDIELSPGELKRLDDMLSRRLNSEPLQYILGKWEFYGLEFFVGEGVLIPRQDTETLVDTALKLLKAVRLPKIADLCSGSGCIAVALEKELEKAENQGDIAAVEKHDEAKKYLEKNLRLHNSKVRLFVGDVLDEKTADEYSNFDMIVSNPPYLTSQDMKNLQKEVRFEPKEALFGDDDGLLFYKGISRIWRKALKPGGYIVFEIGFEQAKDVSDILLVCGYSDVAVVKDLCGKDRVVYGKKAD